MADTKQCYSKSYSGIKFTLILLAVLLGYLTYEFVGKHEKGRTSWVSSGCRSHARVVLPPGSTNIRREAMIQLYHQLNGYTDTYAECINTTEVLTRKQGMKKECSALEKNTKHNIFRALRHALYFERTQILYCAVAKAGSKFLKSFFSAVDDGLPLIGSILHDKTGTKLPDMFYEIRHSKTKAEHMKKLVKESFKVVFTRDPYRRIFSSYIDKLFTPNGVFLQMARQIASVTRNETNKTGTIAFHELVSYLLSIQPRQYNVHFKPASLLCDVCLIQYDFLAKVETFREDLQYIMNVTKATGTFFYRSFEEESNIDYITFRTRRTFMHLNNRMNDFSLSKYLGYLHLWRGFQIAGLIDTSIEYPLGEWESENVTLTSLCNVILDAFYRSCQDASANKQAALVQAYSKVSLEDMEKLRRVFIDDFKLFQYDDRPDKLFDRTAEDKRNQFDFFDILNVKY